MSTTNQNRIGFCLTSLRRSLLHVSIVLFSLAGPPPVLSQAVGQGAVDEYVAKQKRALDVIYSNSKKCAEEAFQRSGGASAGKVLFSRIYYSESDRDLLKKLGDKSLVDSAFAAIAEPLWSRYRVCNDARVLAVSNISKELSVLLREYFQETNALRSKLLSRGIDFATFNSSNRRINVEFQRNYARVLGTLEDDLRSQVAPSPGGGKKPLSNTDGAPTGFGSGFFISSSGHFVTNFHVVKGASRVQIFLVGGGIFDAQVLRNDEANDLALLKIRKATSPLQIRTSLDVQKGERVFTLGFPNPALQGVEPKYTEGVISAFSGIRGSNNRMQITTPIQPGNSGGPLIDAEGYVVGVVVSKLNALAVLERDKYLPENVNFAVKAEYLIPFLRMVPKTERSNKKPSSPERNIDLFERSIGMVLAYGASGEVEPIGGSGGGSRRSASAESSGRSLGMSTTYADMFGLELRGNGSPAGILVVSKSGLDCRLKTTLRAGDVIRGCGEKQDIDGVTPISDMLDFEKKCFVVFNKPDEHSEASNSLGSFNGVPQATMLFSVINGAGTATYRSLVRRTDAAGCR